MFDHFAGRLVRGGWFCLLALSSVSPAFAEPAAEKRPLDDVVAAARAVVQNHCHRCHNGPGSEGGEFDLLKLDAAARAKLLKPADPDRSPLLQRVAKAEMPPKPDRLFAEQADAVRQWIQAGAPAFPMAESNRTFVGAESILTAIRDHLRRADKDDRPFLRFFTLHNLANDSRVATEDLRLVRAALSKSLNSLSWKSRIVAPKPVDPQQIVLAIDVRDYDWDRIDGWQQVMKAYPYGLKFRNLPGEAGQSLRRLDEELEELTDCVLPLVRADWFIAAATRPPLYYKLLDIPRTAAALEKQLKVDVAANFQQPTPERIARAGFHKSGVSGQNRMLERHASVYGYYWKSYDFKADSARVKLTRFPLGPLNLFADGKHPFPHQAFIHDGGEIVFALPNGLQGYMLIDGQDQRIDEGPIQVVADALKTSGTNAIVNGVSCMACHKHGVIAFQDVVRNGSAVFGEAEQKVQKLYPTQTQMNKLLEDDERQFLAALEKTIGPLLRVGDDKAKDLKQFPEPIGELARRYRLGFLDLRTVAHEVNVEKPDELKAKIGEKSFKKLGLDSLLRPGGVIGRLEWEATDGVSLMQELARELRYTPFGVE